MSFYDDKEQVLEFELTQHGKRMLRDGRFKPYGYSFHDDDVIYDHSYANVNENQAEIESRILDTSVYLNAQYNYGGIESYFSSQREQAQEDNTYQVSYNMLGNSSLGNEFNPAWNISFYDGFISSSYAFITGSGQNVPIPQIEMNDEIIHVDVIKNVHEDNLSIINRVGFSRTQEYVYFDDKTLMTVDDNYFLLDVEELNSIFGSENFTIEFFEVEHDTTSKNTPVEILSPLYFSQPEQDSESNIFVEETDQIVEQEELTPQHVEYYFSVEVDEEIDPIYICANIEVPKRRGLYSSIRNDCGELGQIISIKDIYGSDISPEGEPC